MIEKVYNKYVKYGEDLHKAAAICESRGQNLVCSLLSLQADSERLRNAVQQYDELAIKAIPAHKVQLVEELHTIREALEQSDESI